MSLFPSRSRTAITVDKAPYHETPESLIPELDKKGSFRQNNDSIPYRLIDPDKADPTKKYPLLVYLHGSGSRGNDNEKPLRNFLPFITDSARTKNKLPCFILIPQCPLNDVWVSFPGFPNSLSATTEATPSAKLVLALIHHLIETKHMDSNRIYLTGFSMGGEGTFDLLGREPGLFACGVSLAAIADTAKAHIIKNIPTWTFHGNADNVNNIKYIRLMIDALRQQGGNPKFTELVNMQHDCRNEAYRNEELWQWIFEQHK